MQGSPIWQDESEAALSCPTTACQPQWRSVAVGRHEVQSVFFFFVLCFVSPVCTQAIF